MEFRRRPTATRSSLVLLLLQLPLLQGRWERGVEEGVANRYGRGRVGGSGEGSHRGRLRLFGSWVSLFNGLWSHACSASATFPDCIHPWHDVYLPTHPTLIAGEGLWDAHAGEATGAWRELEHGERNNNHKEKNVK